MSLFFKDKPYESPAFHEIKPIDCDEARSLMFKILKEEEQVDEAFEARHARHMEERKPLVAALDKAWKDALHDTDKWNMVVRAQAKLDKCETRHQRKEQAIAIGLSSMQILWLNVKSFFRGRK